MVVTCALGGASNTHQHYHLPFFPWSACKDRFGCFGQLDYSLAQNFFFELFAKFVYLLALLIQSSYSLGLSVLTMATLPKFLEAVGGRVDVELALMLSAYSFGFTFNWMFTFILWHHYWHLERLNAPPSAARRRSYKAPGVLRENNV
uniref:Uncharacterized protein n=1 Tax=Angiostrongylus cantonensis TaxID=6313 RepID=A0A0K0DBU8_ANGCA